MSAVEQQKIIQDFKDKELNVVFTTVTFRLKVAKTITGFYVGRFFQEDEVFTQFVRLTDDFSSKQEAIEWIESMMEEVTERKEGDPSFLFLSLKRESKSMGNSRLSPGIVSLASLFSQ
jgi:hypothetical protein